MSKEFKTYRQILTILRDRGMSIPKGAIGSRVMRILEHENYYNVINGYKTLFLDLSAPTEQFKPGTTFDEVYALFCFDREIRGIYLRYLLKIEHSFKTVIAHEFSALYGHDNYLKLDNFSTSSPEDIAAVTSLFGDIQKEIARQLGKNHPALTHYLGTYGYIPLWVLVDVLTFGKTTFFYLRMKEKDKIAVAKKFHTPHRELHKYMSFLGLARNKCAHNERFFDFHNKSRIKVKSIKNFPVLGIPLKSDGNCQYGTNDLFAIAIIFALLLSRSEMKEFIASMNIAIIIDS